MTYNIYPERVNLTSMQLHSWVIVQHRFQTGAAMISKRGRKLSSILIPVLFFAIANFAWSSPVLRIEVGQHTATINRFAIDDNARLIATASDDKTLRLWNLPEGSLYTTLRVPIGEQLKGALYAVAISPDGKTVITAGETQDADQSFSLYLFDVEKRVLKARIAHLPSAIYHLAYSMDGKYFAAAFAGGYGITVWDSQSGRTIKQDMDYEQRSTWLDFGPTGYLASVSYDGYVRVYDPSFSLIKKAIITPNGKPFSVDFSDDGEQLAIGYSNNLNVDIVDTDLNLITSLAADDLIGTNSAIVAWRKNSNSELYSAGDMKSPDGHYVIRHWQDIASPQKHYIDVPVSQNIVTDLNSIEERGADYPDLFFASADPSWGGIKNDRPTFVNQATLWDARLVALPNKMFAVSQDGLKIAYSQHSNTDDIAYFDTTDLTLTALADRNDLTGFSMPIQDSERIKITHWERETPIFNGDRLKLDDYEMSLAFALDQRFEHALIGTNYSLRWYDAHGEQIRKVTVPAEVHAINIAPNAKLAIVALGDGTIRWYSLAPGEELNELVSLFPYNNGKDWIIWTREGFFGSSDGGGYRLAGYHLNKGEDRRPEWIEFSQIYQTYYAPELILPKLMRDEMKILNRLARIENFDDRFTKNAIPVIELVDYCTRTEKATTKAFIRKPKSPAPPSGDLSIFEKIKFFFQNLIAWFQSLFVSEPANSDLPGTETVSNNTNTVGTAKLEPPVQAMCFPIVGQGQTRGFKRKEKVQSTTFRNQLDRHVAAIDLHYIVKPREGGIGDIDIYVNGQILKSLKQVVSSPQVDETHELKLTQTIALKDGENEISIQAYEKTGGTAAKSDSVVLINPKPDTPDEILETDSPRLIVFSIGIDRYPSPNELKYAVKDSTDFLSTVVSRKSPTYKDVIPFHLVDEQATLQNIEKTVDEIASLLRENDAVLIYVSGHGIRSDDRNFYFIPYGVDDNDLDATAMSQQILKNNVAKLSKTNRIFIFIDSCHSGAVDLAGIQEEISGFDKIKHQLGDNVFILAASGENQEAQDQFLLDNNQRADNGLFAYAVLEGLNGKARRVDDNIVDSFTLGSYVQRRIDLLTKNQTLYKQKARFQMLEGGDVLIFDITRYE